MSNPLRRFPCTDLQGSPALFRASFCRVENRSVSPAYHGCLFHWFSKTQKSVSLSSAEAEFFGAMLAVAMVGAGLAGSEVGTLTGHLHLGPWLGHLHRAQRPSCRAAPLPARSGALVPPSRSRQGRSRSHASVMAITRPYVEIFRDADHAGRPKIMLVEVDWTLAAVLWTKREGDFQQPRVARVHRVS